MANKKVSQLTSKPSVLVTDLFPIADPSTGQLYKTTISDLGTAIGSGVSSVNGLVGAVVLDTDDIQELASPTNKWFTDTRARAALSASSPLDYNSGTGVFSIPAATSSQNGYLTSTDWTTFNSKQAALSGTGFIKISGTTISYDNSTYLTTSAAASTYLALAGGTLTGALNGTSATFTGDLTISSTNPRIYLTDTDNNPDYFISNTDGTFTVYDVTNSTSRFTIGTTGNGTFGGNLTVGSIIKSGGISAQFLKADGSVDSTSYQPILTNPVTGTGTTNTLPKFTGTSKIGNSNVTDSGSLITLGSNSYVDGNLALGSTTAIANRNISNRLLMTGGSLAIGYELETTIMSDVTSDARGFSTFLSTTASSFTLANLYHYRASQSTIGAGSSITTQIGFEVAATLIGATTNYGFRGLIAAGTNRWNLYLDGTANNYMAGGLGIGSTSLTGVGFRQSRNITGAINSNGIISDGQIQSDANNNHVSVNSILNTQATTFTLASYTSFNATLGTLGSGTTITNLYGYRVNSALNSGTNNYGFYGDLAAATGRWNLYMNGTANNHLAGNLLINSTSNNGANLQVTGTATISSSITANSFIKTSGTSLQFLKADGSVDSSTYALDSAVVKLTGNQTVAGVKTFTSGIIANVSTGGDQGFASTNTSTSGSSIFVQNNSASGAGINLVNTSTGIGINLGNEVTGKAIYISNSTVSGSGTGLYIDNYNSANGIEIQSTSTADAAYFAHSAGRGLRIYSSGSGYGLLINNATAATSVPFTIQKQGANKIVFTDAGAATFSSSVTATNGFLRGDLGTSVDAVLRLRGSNSTARTTRLQFEDYNGTIADAFLDFKIPTAGSSTGARLDLGVDSPILSLVKGGNVGINTTSPTNGKLEVQQSATTAALWVQTGGTTSSYTIADFRTGTNASALGILANGSLLIGVTSEDAVGGITIRPTGTTMVFNNLNTAPTVMSFQYNSSAVGSITRSTTTTSYNITSDYRLKEDLKPINGLEIVNKIKVYDYKWKSEDSRMDGVMAHELQEILPYAVTGVKDGEQMQSVDYSKIVPVMVQAIKDLKEKIEILENK